MLVTVDDEREIARLQALLEERVKAEAETPVRCNLGWQGDDLEADVFWLSRYGVWVAFDEADGRYWTPLGTAKPVAGRSLDITCEVNVPFAGVNRRVSGVFARDYAGHTYVLHRGRVGGGRKGIGKTQFLRTYTGRCVELDTAKEPIPLVADLRGPGFLRQLTAFVHSVERFKKAVQSGTVVTEGDSGGFRDEFAGTRSYTLQTTVTADCDHGTVVNGLYRELEQVGCTASHDQYRDLFLLDQKGSVSILFEAKTDVTPASVYQALGQLLYHARAASVPPKRLVAVFPEELPDEVERRFRRVGVEVLRYRLEKADVTFRWAGAAQFVAGK